MVNGKKTKNGLLMSIITFHRHHYGLFFPAPLAAHYL